MGIPATVLVDKKGVIQAVTQPHHVTKTVLLDLFWLVGGPMSRRSPRAPS